MDYRIIHAGAEHLTLLARLFDEYRQFYGKPADLRAAADFLRERILQCQSMLLLAIDDAGEGLGLCQLYPCFSSVSLAPVLILNDLYVAPMARRSGVGRALLEAARRHGQQLGALRLQLETGADNRSAQALYESLGWIHDANRHYSLPLDEPAADQQLFV